MANIPFFIGALVPTILVSQLFMFVTRSWKEGGNIRIVVCHAVSLLLIAFIAGTFVSFAPTVTLRRGK